MNKAIYKVLAYFFAMMSFGSVLEFMRIRSSSAPDIAPQRTYLIINALIIIFCSLLLTRYFWRKSK